MPPVVYRSFFNRVVSILAWASIAVVTVLLLVTAGTAVIPWAPLGAAGLAAVLWAVLWSPSIVVDDDAVTIVNVLRRIRIPWSAVIHVDTKYALTVHVPGKAWSATGAPAPGQLAGLRAGREHRRAAGADGLRPGDLPTTDSGRAAALVRERWDDLREAGAIETGAADRTPVGVEVRADAALALALGIGAIVAAVVAG